MVILDGQFLNPGSPPLSSTTICRWWLNHQQPHRRQQGPILQHPHRPHCFLCATWHCCCSRRHEHNPRIWVNWQVTYAAMNPSSDRTRPGVETTTVNGSLTSAPYTDRRSPAPGSGDATYIAGPGYQMTVGQTRSRTTSSSQLAGTSSRTAEHTGAQIVATTPTTACSRPPAHIHNITTNVCILYAGLPNRNSEKSFGDLGLAGSSRKSSFGAPRNAASLESAVGSGGEGVVVVAEANKNKS